MRLLAVPNWSFGRDKRLLGKFREALEAQGVEIHFLESDVDHNRTVSAFSGDEHAIYESMVALCDLAFDRIDLSKHVGVHPRIGALDVCPLVLLPHEIDPDALEMALALAERIAAAISSRYDLPVFLYEKSERGRHEADLPSLRKGGFGGLIGRTINPDFGPHRAHPRLGVAVVGVRDFLIAFNVDLQTSDPSICRTIARRMRERRAEGDPRFLGVRALGFPLASRECTQISVNVTLPDLTPIDPIIEWIMKRLATQKVPILETELIGVIRNQDLPGATRLPHKKGQVI